MSAQVQTSWRIIRVLLLTEEALSCREIASAIERLGGPSVRPSTINQTCRRLEKETEQPLIITTKICSVTGNAVYAWRARPIGEKNGY